MTGVLKERTTLGFLVGGKPETEDAAAAPPERGVSRRTHAGDTIRREQVQGAASLKTRLHKRTQSARGEQTAPSPGRWGSVPV